MTRWGKYVVGLIWWLLMVIGIVQAAGTELKLEPGVNDYRIGKASDLFTDVRGNMTLEQVKQQKFQPCNQEIINLGFNTRTHWIRIIINNKKNHHEQEWILNTYSSHVSYIDLYGRDTVFQTGSQRHFSTRPLTHREIAFPLRITSGAVDTYYIKIKSYRSNAYHMELQTWSSWNDYTETDWILLSGFFCSILVMFLYNLLLYLSIRDKTYIAYLIYQVGLGLLFFYLKGLAIQYLWYQNNSIHIITTHIGPVMAGIALSWFSGLFLKIKDYSKIAWRILVSFQFLWVFVFLFAIINWLLFPPQAQVYVDLLENLVAGTQSVICMGLGIYVWHKGYKPAKYYVAGFSMLMLGIFAFVIKNLGLLKDFAWSNYIFQYGVLVEQIFLSLALADKINVMKDEKEKMSLENERILREQNQTLEIKVLERTHQLMETNEEIAQQRDELAAQADQISLQRDQLNEAFIKLKELDEFKDALAGMIVHDLKNPLNAIIGLSNKPQLSAADQEAIRQAGKQMLNLTLNILDVQKFEQASVPLNIREHALADIVKDALDQVSLLVINKNQNISYTFSKNIRVQADFELFSRVFMNLLTNAIKYTPNNGTITISVEEKDESRYIISVSDNGQGIPADKLETVFDKFSQVDARKSGNVRSTGLGLTFCKMVVEAHGGRIWVTSQEGQGTTFSFTLAKATPAEEKETTPPATDNTVDLSISMEDRQTFAPFLSIFKSLDVYEGSEILNTLSRIPDSPTLVHWKAEMERAVFTSNQEKYEELLQIMD
jgi:signal transduction histidine kinase